MKRSAILLLASGIIVLFPAFSLACLICDDVLSPQEEALETLAREKGVEALPQFRDILGCPRIEPRLKVIAAREVGKFQDRASIPTLQQIVLEIVSPGFSSGFGVRTAGYTLRLNAASALRAMGEGGIGEKIWEKWRELPPQRQEEVPRLLSELGVPEVQAKHLEMLGKASFDSVAFQIIVELRRTGDMRGIPGVERKLGEWKEKLARRQAPNVPPPALPSMIRYAEGTIRALKGR